MNSLDEVLKSVSNALGVGITTRNLSGDTGYTFALRISELPSATSFEFRIRQGLLSWSLDLFLNNFPQEMLMTFTKAFQNKREEILGLLNSAKQRVTYIDFTANDSDLEELENQVWEQISLTLKIKVSESEKRLIKLRTALIIALSLIIPLFTEDEFSDEEKVALGEEEGEKTRIENNHYERSRLNRALCLDFYGFECQACKKTMKSLYGPIGDGVIHVHHLVPVSLMNTPKRLDPIKDLVPLCPNCHTIAHQENPPISLDRLKSYARG